MQTKLTITKTIFYGLPGLPLAMLGLPLFIYLPSFYSQNLGLSLSAVGLVLLFARTFDVFTDPLIGSLNDRFPAKQSLSWRRKSYILLGIPLLLVGLNFLLRPPTEVSSFYLFSWSFITYLGWTLINIPWLAMGAEISQKYHEKSSLASSREIFAAIGTILVISIPVLLSLQSDLRSMLNVLANILTILLPLALIPLILKVSLNEQSTTRLDNQSKYRLFSKETLSIIQNPAIKKLLPAYFFNSVANALPATLFILYVNYVLQVPDQVGILLISYFLAAIVGIPFWLYLARKTDKHTSWRYALYGSVASFVWVPFIGSGDMIAFLIICIASGFFLGADVVMPSSIQADISQQLSNQTIKKQYKSDRISNNSTHTQNNNENQNSTALLFGLWGMLTKLSLALAIGFAFPILDLAGLQIGEGIANQQTDTGTYTLILLYAFIPIVLKIGVIVQMNNFQFDKNYF